jgi:amidase/aspartyl-tRNA(Asn)/glutamyl-tRNA(Gln) amidotransferase subunit A
VGVAELAGRIRRREISPIEVIDHYAARIEALNPAVNALVILELDEARDRAKLAERKLMSGGALGPLHGVPFALKDCFDFKPGWRNTFGGVRALKDYVAKSWSLFPELVERAGAIAVGKANSPTFGFRGTCDNYLFGPTHNPFNLAKNSGGSSGGSAAVAAAGLLPFAEGGDGGGSIRIPAAWCGVYGFKHSFGRVPMRLSPNTFGALNPFIFEGALTRTVEDAALILSTVVGYHPDDPFSVESSEDFIAAPKRSIRGMRIGYSRDFGIYPVEEIIRTHIDRAVRAFEDAGAAVDEVDIAINHSQRDLSDAWCRMIIPNSLLALEALRNEGMDVMRDHPEDFPPQFHDWLGIGQSLTVLDALRDQVIRSDVYASMQAILNTYDLLVTPTLGCMPVDNSTDGNTVGPSSINGESVDPLIGWCLTYLINFTGHPAASIPAGLSPRSLPIGLQIVGRRHADSDVLAASAAFERAKPWIGDYSVARSVMIEHIRGADALKRTRPAASPDLEEGG